MKHFLIGVHCGYDSELKAQVGTGIDNNKMEWIRNIVKI